MTEQKDAFIEDDPFKDFKKEFIDPYREDMKLYHESVQKYYRLRKTLHELASIEVDKEFKPYEPGINQIIMPGQYKFVHEMMKDVSNEFIESKEQELKELKELKEK